MELHNLRPSASHLPTTRQKKYWFVHHVSTDATKSADTVNSLIHSTTLHIKFRTSRDTKQYCKMHQPKIQPAITDQNAACKRVCSNVIRVRIPEGNTHYLHKVHWMTDKYSALKIFDVLAVFSNTRRRNSVSTTCIIFSTKVCLAS